MNSVIAGYDMVVITGPTATGKTSLAAWLACKLGGEVISSDSRQVYRGMDIGTGKDYGDYIVNGIRIPVHLTDITDPGYKYNVFEFQRDFIKVLADLRKRNIFPVVCGGSGMYVDSIVSGYRLVEVPPDEEMRKRLGEKTLEELKSILSGFRSLHNKTDVDTKKRAIRAIEIEEYYKKNPGQTEMPPVNPLIAGILIDRESRRKRITRRLKERLESGMIDEVRSLMNKGVPSETLIYYGLEYKHITLYLTGHCTYDEMFKSLETAIHQFAKRQMTWFRGMERRGIKINWIDGELPMEKKIEKILFWLNGNQ